MINLKFLLQFKESILDIDSFFHLFGGIYKLISQNLVQIQFKPIPILPIIVLFALTIIMVFLYFKKEKKRNPYLEEYNQKRKKREIAFKYMHSVFHEIKDSVSPNYFLKSLFDIVNNSYVNEGDYKFWQEISEYHSKNLIACLSRSKPDIEDVLYFERLQKDRFENTITHTFSDTIFGEVVGQTKYWALNGDKQNAARLLSLAIKIGLICPEKNTQIAKLRHCNKLLGLRKDEKFDLKSLFEHPFITNSLKLTPSSVFKNGVEILDYLKDRKELKKAFFITYNILQSGPEFKEYVKLYKEKNPNSYFS